MNQIPTNSLGAPSSNGQTRLDKQLKDKQASLRKLNESVAERHAYLREQEKLVDDAIAGLNVRLQEFNSELEHASKEKEQLLKDIQQLRSDKDVLSEGVARLTKRYTLLEDTYQETAKNYRLRLEAIKAEIQKASQEREAITVA